ncbi:MAG: flagellar biosynthetic protein FliQ [Deltaproteobacteria bacterium]|nr:flagellar biosynthetic protein FliQ [Deltaproteobacteria bacterium]
MNAGIEYDVLVAGIRALLLIGLPLIAGITLIGVIVGSLQAATTIQEPALGYAARIAALLIVLYLLFPAFARTCTNLAELAFR